MNTGILMIVLGKILLVSSFMRTKDKNDNITSQDDECSAFRTLQLLGVLKVIKNVWSSENMYVLCDATCGKCLLILQLHCN